MRILHTADWHLGKTLEGNSRLPEQQEFIEELCDIVECEAIDAVIIAGDVYDTVNPPARAEELFYHALERLSGNGRRAIVVIAGNHDNPERLCASSPLALRNGITLMGVPTDLPPVSGQKVSPHRVSVQRASSSFLAIHVPGVDYSLEIAALPYPSEARLNQLLVKELDESSLQQAYADRVQQIWNHSNGHFSPSSVRLAVSHLFMAGSSESGSERAIQVGGAYTVPVDVVPQDAQYLALGHLHRAQTVTRSPIPTRYAGSPLAYSFSEANQAKSVTVLDVEPGTLHGITEIPLSSGKPLVRWQATEGLVQVQNWCEQQRDFSSWVDLEIHVTEALTSQQVQVLRQSHPGLLNIRPIFPQQQRVVIQQRRDELPMDELFREFYRKQTGGGQPSPAVTKLFLELVQAESDTAEEEVQEVVMDEAN